MIEADEKTVNEMIGYFMPCWHNAAQGSEAKKRFARYIDTLTRMSQQEPQNQQEPVEAIENGDDTFVCGNCGTTVGWDVLEIYGLGEEKYDYCPHCGKPVKWA